MGVANAQTKSSFHKQSVIVVNGRLYVADDHATLWVYALPAADDTVFANGFEAGASVSLNAVAARKSSVTHAMLQPRH